MPRVGGGEDDRALRARRRSGWRRPARPRPASRPGGRCRGRRSGARSCPWPARAGAPAPARRGGAAARPAACAAPGRRRRARRAAPRCRRRRRWRPCAAARWPRAARGSRPASRRPTPLPACRRAWPAASSAGRRPDGRRRRPGSCGRRSGRRPARPSARSAPRRPPARRSAPSASRSGRAADPRTAVRARPCCARPGPSTAGTRVAATSASCQGPSMPTHAFGSSAPAEKTPRGRPRTALRATAPCPAASSAEASVSPGSACSGAPSHVRASGAWRSTSPPAGARLTARAPGARRGGTSPPRRAWSCRARR